MPKSVKKNMNRKNQRTKRKQFKRTNKKHGERKLRTNKKQLRRNKRTKRKIRGGSQPGYGFGSGFEDNASVESVDSGVGGVGKDYPFAEFERLLDQSLEHGKKLGLQCNPSRFPFGGTKGLECRVKGVIETIDKYLTDKDKLKQNKETKDAKIQAKAASKLAKSAKKQAKVEEKVAAKAKRKYLASLPNLITEIKTAIETGNVFPSKPCEIIRLTKTGSFYIEFVSGYAFKINYLPPSTDNHVTSDPEPRSIDISYESKELYYRNQREKKILLEYLKDETEFELTQLISPGILNKKEIQEKVYNSADGKQAALLLNEYEYLIRKRERDGELVLCLKKDKTLDNYRNGRRLKFSSNSSDILVETSGKEPFKYIPLFKLLYCKEHISPPRYEEGLGFATGWKFKSPENPISKEEAAAAVAAATAQEDFRGFGSNTPYSEIALDQLTPRAETDIGGFGTDTGASQTEELSTVYTHPDFSGETESGV